MSSEKSFRSNLDVASLAQVVEISKILSEIKPALRGPQVEALLEPSKIQSERMKWDGISSQTIWYHWQRFEKQNVNFIYRKNLADSSAITEAQQGPTVESWSCEFPVSLLVWLSKFKFERGAHRVPLYIQM